MTSGRPIWFLRRSAKTSQFWKKFARNRPAVVGLALVLFFLALGLLAPWLAPFKPLATGPHSFRPPGDPYRMGTDDLGRDIWSGVLWGTRVSIAVGLLAALASTAIGVLIGAAAGYYRGMLDDLLMRVTEFFLVIPRFFLVLVMVALFGNSLWHVILAIGILSWPVTARLVRVEFLALREKEFVESMRAAGASDLRIILRHILPNAVPPIVVSGSLQIARAILMEAGLSFLGLGDPNQISWGVMLYNAQRFLRHAWWISTFPGLAIFLIVMGFNLVGDGLNDALNPRQKGRELQ
jgi:peptide/nickel transport system permease protein